MSDPDPATSEFPAMDRRGYGKLYDEERHPKARRSDGGWRYWAAWCYRMIVPALAIVVAAIAVARTQSDVERQAEGRAVAIDSLCGYSNGVAVAGRKALAGQLKGQSGHGLPPEAQADYVATVNSRLLAAAGVTAKDVLIKAGPNRGLIDCRKLRVAAKAPRGG